VITGKEATDPSTFTPHAKQLCTGAPRSPQRTWDENEFLRLLSAGSTAMVGLRPSTSAHVRWGERGAPVQSCFASGSEVEGPVAISRVLTR